MLLRLLVNPCKPCRHTPDGFEFIAQLGSMRFWEQQRLGEAVGKILAWLAAKIRGERMSQLMRHPEFEIDRVAVEVHENPGGVGIRQMNVQRVAVVLLPTPQGWNNNRVKLIEFRDQVAKINNLLAFQLHFLAQLR